MFRYALRHLILYELRNIAPIWYVQYIIDVPAKLFLQLVTYEWSESAELHSLFYLHVYVLTDVLISPVLHV